MSSVALKISTRRIRFGDMAICVNDRVDDPSKAGVDRYVGLEHLDSESLRIRRWGTPSDVEATKLRFRKGDIIFGRRRAYQRKLAVADFDGICSAHAMVLRARPEMVLREFLPFWMQSEHFMERALAISVGSLSPTINWKTLAQEEFFLPALEQQHSIVGLFRAAEDVLEARRTVAVHATTLLRSMIDAAFEENEGVRLKTSNRRARSWVPTQLSALTHKIVDGVHKRPNYIESGVPFLTVENLTRGPGIDFSTTRFITNDDHREFSKRADPEKGDVLVSKDGTLGVARVVEDDVPFSIFVSIALLKPKREVIDPWFLRYFFDSRAFRSRLASKTSGSALKHIHLVDFRSTEIPLPPLHVQHRLVGAIRSVDRAARRASVAVVEATQFKKSLLADMAAA